MASNDKTIAVVTSFLLGMTLAGGGLLLFEGNDARSTAREVECPECPAPPSPQCPPSALAGIETLSVTAPHVSEPIALGHSMETPEGVYTFQDADPQASVRWERRITISNCQRATPAALRSIERDHGGRPWPYYPRNDHRVICDGSFVAHRIDAECAASGRSCEIPPREQRLVVDRYQSEAVPEIDLPAQDRWYTYFNTGRQRHMVITADRVVVHAYNTREQHVQIQEAPIRRGE